MKYAKVFFFNQRIISRFMAVLTLMFYTHVAIADEASNLWQKVQKAGVLRCGAAVAPPYVMRDPKTGEYSGYFSDLCRDFGEKVLKVKVNFVDATWETLVAGLQSDKWDLAMALNQTPERALAISFTEPAVDYQISFLKDKRNPKLANLGSSLNDYDKPDITFAVMSGTVADKTMTAALKQAKIMRVPGADELRLSLMAHRADLIADANETNEMFVHSNSEWAEEIIPTPALVKQGVSFGLNKNISPADLMAINIYIKQSHDNGNIDKLVQKSVATLTGN